MNKIELIIKDCREHLRLYGEAFITEEEVDLIDNRIKELEVLEDDLKDKRVVYIDTPEFAENYIPKQKVLKEVDKLLNAFRKIEFNKVTIWNSLIQLKENLLEDK